MRKREKDIFKEIITRMGIGFRRIRYRNREKGKKRRSNNIIDLPLINRQGYYIRDRERRRGGRCLVGAR